MSGPNPGGTSETSEGPGEAPSGGARWCSAGSRAADEPVEATAPFAVSWVGVVAPGSWPAGSDELVPEALRAGLADVAGVRVVLLRPVGRGRTGTGLLLAGTVPGRTWLREVPQEQTADVLGHLADPHGEALHRLATGRDPGLGAETSRPVVLVCTNGARDACCAREGRGAALELQRRLGVTRARLVGRTRPRADVWESSHLGGHRFAPTAAVLPSGMVLGGLGPDPAALPDAVEALLDGRAVVDGYRGRSTYPAVEQAAEAAVRRHLAVIGVNAWTDDVRVDGSEPLDEGPGSPRRVFVRHSGGRTFTVLTERVETDIRRPVSCGAEPTPVVVWETEVVPDSVPGVYVTG